MKHINWQSRIRNKQHLPSAPIPGHFPFLMTVVTLQAQHCSPAVPWAEIPSENAPPLPSPCAFSSSGDTSGARMGSNRSLDVPRQFLACIVWHIICDLPFPIPVPHWALSLAEHRSRAVLALPKLRKFPSIRNLRVSGGFSELLQHHHHRQWS